MVEIEKELENGSIIQVNPQGFSMYPVIVPGRDAVLIEKADVGQAHRADVLLYRRNSGMLVLHRVWKKKNETFYMVGDNQTEIEGPLESSQIKGKMIAVIRKGKKISVTNPVYSFVTRFWLFLRPVRPVFWKISSLWKKVTAHAEKPGKQR